tara:strand:+ start:64 stop:264 length:201 start_codon:yes stop_codon:yes gene_type:complete
MSALSGKLEPISGRRIEGDNLKLGIFTQVGLCFKRLYSILVVSYFMWSGALDRTDVLLSYQVMTLA